jgi:formamidopyrimidine-DNA glycosylase
MVARRPIKSALLNQKLLSGVGKYLADESLFRAGVRPRRKAASLTQEQLRKLFLAVQTVLKEAIAAGGSSISDYVDADGEKGLFSDPASRSMAGKAKPAWFVRRRSSVS